MSKKPEYQFLHSTYWKDKKGAQDAIVATLKDIDTGEVKLQISENPNCTVYVTKKSVRSTHDSKKLYENMENLDPHVIPYRHKRSALQNLLYGKNFRGYVGINKLLNSPYVYGSDIEIEVGMKQHFLNSTDRICQDFRVGGLDIETSMLGGKEIFHITYVSPELKCYTAVLASFLDGFDRKHVEERCHELVFGELENVNDDTKEILKEFNVELNIELFQTEMQMIDWIFAQIHKDKPEFVSVWNIDFDIPYILERMEVFNKRFSSLCHPDVPYKYRTCHYKKDNNKKVQHFTHKWHLFKCAGYTQFYDSQNLLSILRKHKGVQPSYALDYQSSVITGMRKLKFKNASHTVMQTKHQVEYTAYNIVDTIITVLIEKRINDVKSMMLLLKDTNIDSLVQQTVQLKNWMYDYLKKQRKVPASWAGRNLHDTDDQIVNVGGNVLAPGLAWRTGVTKIKQLIDACTNMVSKLIILASDIDVVSMYPYIMAACNYCKETKIMTILKIGDFATRNIVDFIGHLTATKENAVYLCKKYLNLPGYNKISKMFDDWIANKG